MVTGTNKATVQPSSNALATGKKEEESPCACLKRHFFSFSIRFSTYCPGSKNVIKKMKDGS